MSQSQQLSKRIRELFLDGRWIANTNFKQELESCTWPEVLRKIGTHNSIAALCFHVNYYVGGLIQAFREGKLEIRDKFSFDMPALHTENDWKELLSSFLHNAAELEKLVSEMDDNRLGQFFIDPRYGTWQRNLEGLIEHGYYHLGQISLLRRLL